MLNIELANYIIGFQLKTFPSWIAFTAWKEEEEQSTYSYFVRPTGEVVSAGETNDGTFYIAVLLYLTTLQSSYAYVSACNILDCSLNTK